MSKHDFAPDNIDIITLTIISSEQADESSSQQTGCFQNVELVRD
jgi:hypothetical protein